MGLLDDKVVVITGAGRGVGRAIAIESGAQGASVVVADYGVSINGGDPSSTVADEVADEIRQAGGLAVAIGETVVESAGAKRIIDSTLEHFGRLDGVVCSAGLMRPNHFLEMSEEDFDSVVATHLRGHFTVLQAGARAMVERNIAGSLIAMGSGYLSGTGYMANYRAAKAGVLALALTAAIDLAPTGIRVNCIAPAANTRMTESFGVKVHGEAADVAPMATFLLSDLSGDVNGQIFSIAGGRISGWADPFQDYTATKDGRWTAEEISREIPSLVRVHPSDGAGVLASAPIN
jgi:NAD(P)-dependent dehydrogenase (short-subunit alcohol dehydrogenase family)